MTERWPCCGTTSGRTTRRRACPPTCSCATPTTPAPPSSTRRSSRDRSTWRPHRSRSAPASSGGTSSVTIRGWLLQEMTSSPSLRRPTATRRTYSRCERTRRRIDVVFPPKRDSYALRRLSALPREQLGAPAFVGPLRCSAEEVAHALRECFRLAHRQVVVGLELCPARVRNPADELVRELEHPR